MHFNVGAELTREQHGDVSVGTIIEGPFDWKIRPVAEVRYESEFNTRATFSGLVGLIWLAAGIRAVIATLGGDGVLLVTKTEARHIPAVPVKPLDTTGAGDAFIGSFAHFYALSGDVADALHWAVRYAALSVTRRGTQKSYVDAAAFREFCAVLEDGPPAR